MTWLHRSYKHYIQITQLRIICCNKSHHSSNDITEYDATICQILKIKSNNIHWVLCYRHLFTSLGWFWNVEIDFWFDRGSEKREEKRKWKSLGHQPWSWSSHAACPLKISKRTTIEYRERDWRRERDFVRARVLSDD